MVMIINKRSVYFPITVIFLYVLPAVSGQSCSSNQFNSSTACYSNVKSQLSNLLENWPENSVLPNISNAFVTDLCKAYLNATLCSNSTLSCNNDPSINDIKAVGNYICIKQNVTFSTKSDCVHSVHNSNNQSITQCDYMTATAAAMKDQMTSVDMCYYYNDAASCAYTPLESTCGNDTGMALIGLMDIVAQQRINNCSFAHCNDGDYCRWGQTCRSFRSCACAIICPQMSDPICASDGLIYRNPCLMRKAACTNQTWLVKRPRAYCDIHAVYPKLCTDLNIDQSMSCASPIYNALVDTLSSSGAYLFSPPTRPTDSCSRYKTFETCMKNTTRQCVHQNIQIVTQFYDYQCSSTGSTNLNSESVSACRLALYSDASARNCLETYNTTLLTLPYLGLKQYSFSISDELSAVCTGSNILYQCARPRIKALCDQKANDIFDTLFNGTLDLFQENCAQGCQAAKGDVYGIISTNNWSSSRNTSDSKCSWRIKVPDGMNVNLLVYPSRPFDCEVTRIKFLNFYSGDSEKPKDRIGEYCPNTTASDEVISTKQSINRMTVLYNSVSTNGQRAPDFIAVYYAGLDACASNPCTSGVCVNELGGYTCKNSSFSIEDKHVIGVGRDTKQYEPMCNSGWTLYMNMCYMAVKESADEPTAELGCRNSGSHLITILSATENDFVTQLATRMGVKTIWTGLRFEDNTRWKWLSRDGATFFNWANGQPNNPGEQRCVVMNITASGVWETSQCFPQTAEGYVCRVPPVDYCNPNPCQNGGSCSATASGGRCACPAGFTGVICEQRISDACASNPCLNNGTCTSTATGSYQCACTSSFTGTNCETPISFCASTPCLNGGTCVNGATTYTCTCATGFTGTNCQTPIDLCSPNPCINGGTCVNGTCRCPTGFTGPRCQTANDPCTPNPCQNGGICAASSNGSYTCSCPSNFTGPTCSTRASSGCSTNPCLNGGTCTDAPSRTPSYTCACPSTYTGVNCETRISACASSPCLNGGTCTASGSTYTCACVLGFTGTNCETNINECLTNPCLNGGTCVDGVNEFSCKCTSGWSGATCNQRISNCEPNPCKHNGTCVTLSVTEYICKCADGWVGEQCESDNDECAYSPCASTATCLNTPGSFRCTCPSGVSTCTAAYTPSGSSSTACSSNPCRNGGTCRVSGNGFNCNCTTDYSGPICDTGRCDSGWLYSQGYCYLLVTTPTSNSGSQKYCSQRSGGLSSVRSVDERDFIGRQMAAQRVDRAWIGAMMKNGGWSWSDGTSWVYSSWYTNEPRDSSGSSCVRMITGYGFSWDTKSCTTQEPFVCKKLANGGQNYCSNKPCQNGGTCVNLPDRYECSCPSGYTGTTCQTQAQSPSGCTSCQNGGTCSSGTCKCAQGYTGSSCQASCPNGWTWWSSTCYFAVNTAMKYDKAVSTCPQQQQGSYLLTIQSQSELEQAGILMNQLQSNVWLGMKYDAGRSSYVWVTGSSFTSTDFKAWNTGQPVSQQTRNCVRIIGYTGFVWETEDCSHNLKFICKYKG